MLLPACSCPVHSNPSACQHKHTHHFTHTTRMQDTVVFGADEFEREAHRQQDFADGACVGCYLMSVCTAAACNQAPLWLTLQAPALLLT